MGAMFDADGKVRDPEALRSLTFSGAPRRAPKPFVRDGKKITPTVDDAGRPDGFQTEHASGRIDCDVFARAVDVTTDNGT